jgi:peptidoglycan/xylan/chitin deacetylase (PgdA/CDA1 family)
MFILLLLCFASLFYYTYISFAKTGYVFDEKIYSTDKNKKVIVAFRNDDIRDFSDPIKEEKVLNIFLKNGIRQTFAIIPDFENYKEPKKKSTDTDKLIVKKLKRWIKEEKIDVALHGFRHKRRDVGLGEFDGLDYKKQLELINKGKKILEKHLGAKVKIFSPPWNLADSYTIKACREAGIKIFSGYLGENDLNGVSFLNTNAILFPKRYGSYGKNNSDLKHLKHILNYALNSDKLTFIIVFYHSRTDFNSSNDYHYLDNLLQEIKSDNRIEIMSITKIVDLYKDYLFAFNQAGFNIKQAKKAIHSAKPYTNITEYLYHKLRNNSLHNSLKNVFQIYWSGMYREASLKSIKIIKKCNSIIFFGRLIFIFFANCAFLLIYFTFKKYYPRRLGFITIVISLIFFITPTILFLFDTLSKIRIQEFYILSILIFSSLFISFNAIKYFRKFIK